MSAPKIVLLGMLTKIPVGGVVWLIGQYAEGFRRLGFDPYYVEAHARTPSMFMHGEGDNATDGATAFLDAELRRFDLAGKWAFHALHDDGAVYGMSASQLDRLYREAALIINVHGGTVPLEEHTATDRLVYLGTDPVELEIEVHRGERETLEFLDAHCAYFTWGLNHGGPDCRVPWDPRYPLVPSPPPVVLDWWENDRPPGDAFTTVGNWRQPWRNLVFDGETYTWSKHHEFLKVLDLPRRVDHEFELALSSYESEDQELLEDHGWRVRPSMDFSGDADRYRDYLIGSTGEFTVAKDQNVRLRSGWFSERSATYLAAGRPVVTQDTGFGSFLPTGEGLLSFTDLDSAASAVEKVVADLPLHAAAAQQIAREFLAAERVVGDLLEEVDLFRRRRSRAVADTSTLGGRGSHHIPLDLDLLPVARRPVQLRPGTIDRIRHLALPAPRARVAARASVVVVTWNNLPFTRLCLESLLTNTHAADLEIVVVDNASSDGTADYLRALAGLHSCVRLIWNHENTGFAAACNQGLRAARGETLVLLNNDTIVPPGWLGRLRKVLVDSEVGLVGPVTNNAGNEARIPSDYRTYGELLAFASERSRSHGDLVVDLPMLTLFCTAFRRATYERLGPLDESFGVGMFEDDDYSRRAHEAGLRTVCAEGAFVHHFGEASFGHLRPSGEWSRLFEENRTRFEQKWGIHWTSHGSRVDAAYQALVDEVRSQLSQLPPGSHVAVISRGDDALVSVAGIRAEHFPAAPDMRWSGHYPATERDALRLLAAAAERGVRYVAVPTTAGWWLDHYPEIRTRLVPAGTPSASETCAIYHLISTPGGSA